MADTPVRTGYLEGLAGITPYGSYVRGELGIKPADNFSAFVYGERRTSDWDAGVGFKWMFDL